MAVLVTALNRYFAMHFHKLQIHQRLWKMLVYGPVKRDKIALHQHLLLYILVATFSINYWTL